MIDENLARLRAHRNNISRYRSPARDQIVGYGASVHHAATV